MAYYLLQLSYTPEGWATQLQDPQNRVEAVKAFKTTPLMTIDESLEALRAAAGAGYQPPGG